jgi:hypothetical protein
MGEVAMGQVLSLSLNNLVFSCQYQSNNTPHMISLVERQTGKVPKAFFFKKSNVSSEIGVQWTEK